MKGTAIFLLGCCLASGQGRPIDWPSYSGDAQRSGFEKLDSRITKDNVKDFQLVLKRKLDGAAGPYSLTPPIVIGLLISYRGFKELGVVAGNAGNLWAIDVDTDRLFWQKHFDAVASGACAGGAAAVPALVPPINFAARPQPVAAARPGAADKKAKDPVRPAGGYGASRAAYGVASDGKLHIMNTSNGDDMTPALPFLPAHMNAASLTVVDGTVYTTATDCGGSRGGVWARDIEKKELSPASFPLNGGRISRHGGLAMGTDGTVFVQTGAGELDAASNKWSNTLLALTPKKLKLTSYFAAAGSGSSLVTPVVFTYKERGLVVSASADGRLCLLDAKAPGGQDHKTPLYQTPAVAAAGGVVWGGLSSWQETGGKRWILAPVWGAVNPELKVAGTNGDAAHGSIVAFQLEDHDGKLSLTPAWVSRDIRSPEQPTITSGVVFALSAGDYGNDERQKSPAGAVLYALDGTTGKEMYSTGSQVTAPGNLTGMTLANGRVFFTATDGTLYGFGIYLER